MKGSIATNSVHFLIDGPAPLAKFLTQLGTEEFII
jgi:hypothetical protein